MLACAVARGFMAFELTSLLIGINSSKVNVCFVIGFSPVSLIIFSMSEPSKTCPDGVTTGREGCSPEIAQSNILSSLAAKVSFTFVLRELEFFFVAGATKNWVSSFGGFFFFDAQSLLRLRRRLRLLLLLPVVAKRENDRSKKDFFRVVVVVVGTSLSG